MLAHCTQKNYDITTSSISTKNGPYSSYNLNDNKKRHIHHPKYFHANSTIRNSMHNNNMNSINDKNDNGVITKTINNTNNIVDNNNSNSENGEFFNTDIQKMEFSETKEEKSLSFSKKNHDNTGIDHNDNGANIDINITNN